MSYSFKLALALPGGGFTGYLFEIGALAALDDLFDNGFTCNDFDLYIGVSAGAAAASLMANRVRPGEILEANLTGQRPYYFERRDIFVPAMGEGLKTALRAVQQTLPLLRLYYRNRHEMTLIDLLDQAQDALPSGLYTLEPFRRYLEATFKAQGLSNSFDGLRGELYIPAVDLETGLYVIFGEGEMRKVAISQAITASSAAPVYFCPVRVDGRDYIDGGIARVPFFDLPFQKGAEFLVIVNPSFHLNLDSAGRTGASSGALPERLRDKGFLTIAEQASRINFAARFAQALQTFRADFPDKEVFVISPQPTETCLSERSFLSFRDRVHLLHCGYRSAATVVREQFGRLRNLFARHGVALSLARFEERARNRIELFTATAPLLCVSTPWGRRRAGWSSAT